jgi:flavin-dependent dehydrogenase
VSEPADQPAGATASSDWTPSAASPAAPVGPCDVLIAGAGPAGADLARRLADAGASVVLIDSLPDLRRAAFSSAALPWTAVLEHGLPEDVIAARWSGWRLLGPGEDQRCWERAAAAGVGGAPLGAVLDFAALRHWLAGRAIAAGAVVRLGWRALRIQQQGGDIRTLVRAGGGEHLWLQSRWVVDATGQARVLLGEPTPEAGPLVSGVGVEWLLAVDPDRWRRWADRLSFLLGSDWVPQGYGWVFPMGPGQLKLGVCRLEDPSRRQPALHRLQSCLLQRLDLGQAEVLERHGGLIRSTIHRRETHRRGRLIGLGDAVSTANLLGGEGIRHALASSAVLAPLLLRDLAGEGGGKALASYPRRLRRRLGWRWSLSGRLARRTWLGLDSPAADARLRRLLEGLRLRADAEDLSALLFDYRFERYGLRALPYLLGWR